MKEIKLTKKQLEDKALVQGLVDNGWTITLRDNAPAPAPAPQKEYVPYTKADGTTVLATTKQVAAWDAFKSQEHKSLEQVKKEFADKKSAYKPSQALVDALKANPAMSRKDALAYDFVGTKKDLAALKRELKLR